MRVSNQYPLIREFARGYLHQDVVLEYGDPRKAAVAYVSDLGKDALQDLEKEAAQMRKNFQRLSSSQLNHELSKLGSMWNFKSFEEFDKVLQTFERER